MSQKFSNTDRYPATPAQIMAMLQDPQYLAEKYAALGDISCTVDEHSPSDGGVSSKVSREVESTLPDMAKKVLGQTTKLVQSEQWRAQGDGFARPVHEDALRKRWRKRGRA